MDEYHNGIDIAADEGQSVYAVKTGTVTDIHTSETYGNVMEFETDDGYTVVYNHLQKYFRRKANVSFRARSSLWQAPRDL